MEEAQYAARPDTLKHLRACRTCKLIKTEEQFTESFCENCWADWTSKGEMPSNLARGVRHDTAIEHTTADFDGLVSMMRPDDSWVARWLQMNRMDPAGNPIPFKPGLYAIALPGEEGQASAAQGAEGEEEDEQDEEDEEDEDGAGAGAGAKDDDDDL